MIFERYAEEHRCRNLEILKLLSSAPRRISCAVHLAAVISAAPLVGEHLPRVLERTFRHPRAHDQAAMPSALDLLDIRGVERPAKVGRGCERAPVVSWI
ncbi:hypothetical protein PsYK624_075520 [Phanerochaete sordida]|uniref:Uncharacterized protein n=1 Tax=Phanerochaete sordida TaxID=48140 RepID=A0A9P3G8V6_9APHY|nr:hypothetical protein PsYK624_075520 [Phanerochaete sordida]